MKLQISNKAAAWYKEELNLTNKSYLRFFVRYGFGGIQPGFSLGVGTSEPFDPIVTYEKNNIIFYIESADSWYFDGHDLKIEYDEKLLEPAFLYV